jgi:predicted nucleic-acid-binding protein
MIAVDTNILARYYVDDPSDPEAKRQRPIARRLMQDTAGIFVSVTVVLELAWILKSLYGFAPGDTARAIEHLVGLPNVTVESWTAVLQAARLHEQGLEFADAMHLARAGQCEAFYTFDDRKFARRAGKLGLTPAVTVPKD